MSAIKSLVSKIVDYAGLFPPAQLPLDQVIQNFEEYLGGEYSWMLARLVIPVGKTSELESHPTFKNSKHNWRISALLPPVSDSTNFDDAIDSLMEFNQRYASNQKAMIDNVEIRTPTVDSVAETVSKTPSDVVAFLEIPHANDPREHIAMIANSGNQSTFAKIRTGGVTSELIPSASEVARFISTCASLNVGMKATAGLHHPIRGDFRLTYEDNPDFGTMFGFLNVFVAATFAYAGHNETEFLENVLNEKTSHHFQFNENEIKFGDKSVSSHEVKTIRNEKLATFGSCSFTEPTSELTEIGWL